MKLVGINAGMSFGEPGMTELWRTFGPRVREVTNRASSDSISMRLFDPPLTTGPRRDSPFVQWATVEVTDFGHVPTGLETHVIPAGLFAVFVHRGTADDFEKTAHLIFGQWLPTSRDRLAPREFFEVLGPDYRPEDPDASEEVWIPIQLGE